MSNIVLFETEEEVKAYKSVLGEGYKINVEAYVRYLQEKFPNLEKYSIENQSRVIVIKALTTAWAFTGMQWTIEKKENLSQDEAERMIMSNTLACVALSIKYLCTFCMNIFTLKYTYLLLILFGIFLTGTDHFIQVIKSRLLSCRNYVSTHATQGMERQKYEE